MSERQLYTADAINAFRRILRALRVAAGELQSTGMSAAQLYVLRQLHTGEPLSIKQLAERTLTDRSSVAAVVQRLADQGLVRRAWSRTDRRRAEITLTAKGQQALAAAPPAPTSLLIAAIEQLSTSQVAALAESLSKLVQAMGLESAPAPFLFEEMEQHQRQRARRAVSK